jgi:hypothetical protein
LDTHRITLQRAPSSPSGEERRQTTVGLPPDLLDKARARVKVVALLMLGTAAFMLGSDIPFEGIGALTDGLDAVTAWAVILPSALLYGFARSKRFRPQTILNLGLAYEIALCMLMSLLIPYSFHYEVQGYGVGVLLSELLPSITWVTPIIIMFPLIIPSPPRRTLVVALASAATVPLGLFFWEMAGLFNVELRVYPHTFLSPAIAVAMAYFGSRVVYNIGLDVARARRRGSYQLETCLGAGGMGEVWRARHRMLARPAAIKLVKPEVLIAAGAEGQAVMLSRFEREAQTTALLRSPHTVELFDFGVADDGSLYYVMELLDGFDLDTLTKTFGPVPPDRAIHILQQVCHSLAEAHEKGLIHRDIKPANIYVCRYGRDVDYVKVLDFGMVKAPNEPGGADANLTAPNVAGGTPAFMATEQVLGSSPVDGRTDIYAMGCVAYWLLTGQLVFDGENAMQVMMHHVNTQPTPPSSRSEIAIPMALESLILQCLEKDPGRRPQSADELAVLLSECRTEPEWTQERAHHWWETHQPAPTSGA